MNSNKLEQAIRGLILCGLLLVSNLLQAQWDHSLIETLSDEANQLKDQGLHASAYDLYPKIMHQMRIHEGLYSENQVPMLIELAAWHVQRSEHEEVDALLDRAEFYVSKAENPLLHYKSLVAQRLYLPDEQQCFEREEEGFVNSSQLCKSERNFRADAFIAATEIMVKVVEISDDRISDLTALARLAGYTAVCVFEAYEMVANRSRRASLDARDNIVFTTNHVGTMEKYQFKKWENLKRRTLKTLEQEFNMDSALSSL